MSTLDSSMNPASKLRMIDLPDGPASGAPMYERLKLAMIAALNGGVFAPGERLPTETALCRHFGMSRTTVVRAMVDLEAGGYVVRRQGAGTFAAERKMEKTLFSLEGFSEEMRRSAHTPSSRVLSFERMRCDSDHAKMLQIPPGDEVYRVRRVRLADLRPAVLESIDLAVRRFPALEQHFDPCTDSLYDVVKREYGVAVASADFTVEAVTLAAEEARELAVPRGQAALVVVGVSFDDDGVPVEWNRSLYPGSLYRFVCRSAVAPPSI